MVAEREGMRKPLKERRYRRNNCSGTWLWIVETRPDILVQALTIPVRITAWGTNGEIIRRREAGQENEAKILERPWHVFGVFASMLTISHAIASS
jgi:hypothetical protein